MPKLETYKGIYLWKYVPNFPAALAFGILFLILTLAHAYKLYKYRTWYTIPFITGGIMSTLGYTLRALSQNATSSLPLYLLQAIFILLPPCLFAATLYTSYSRLVTSLPPSHSSPSPPLPHTTQLSTLSPIPPRHCTLFFLLADLFCLNMQSTGASLLPKPHLVVAGNAIIIAGLAAQVVVFAGFVACISVFHHRLAFTSTLRRSEVLDGTAGGVQWRRVLGMLYITSALISARNAFRLVEYGGGQGSYLLKHEWPAYVFDGVLMVGVMCAFLVWYPPVLRAGATESVIELRVEDERKRRTSSRGTRGQW